MPKQCMACYKQWDSKHLDTQNLGVDEQKTSTNNMKTASKLGDKFLRHFKRDDCVCTALVNARAGAPYLGLRSHRKVSASVQRNYVTLVWCSCALFQVSDYGMNG